MFASKTSRLNWRRSWLRLPKLSQFRQFVLNMGQRRVKMRDIPRRWLHAEVTVRQCCAVLQCAEIVMTSPLLLCSYLRTRCPRAPPRSRRCSGGRIVSAHTAAQLHLPLPLHLPLQRRDCRGTHGRESAGSRSGTAGRCRWCGLHRGDSV